MMHDVVETKILSFQRRIDSVKDQLDSAEKELDDKDSKKKEKIKAIHHLLSVCTENMMKELEKLDSLTLSKTSADVQSKRKGIVRRIQELLGVADVLEIRVTAARTGDQPFFCQPRKLKICQCSSYLWPSVVVHDGERSIVL